MIIIHVITAFGIGGAEKLLLNVVNRQVERHTVHLIYLKPISDLISKVDKRAIIKRIPFNFLTSRNLVSYYKKHNPDIIHTHLGHADILGLWAAKKSKAKVFCTMHNIYFKQDFSDKIFFKIYKFLFLKRLPKSNVISISKSVENHVINKLSVPNHRSFLLYNAIEPKNCIKKTSTDCIHLLFVGRLEKQKSIKTLLKAIQYLKGDKIEQNFKLTIVGDGSLKKQLLGLVNDFKINELITFTGKQESVDEFYEESDIFVLPSIWEGFGIVILEAFRAKLAVVASNIEGPAELISHEENGLLFEPQNHIQLAENLKMLIEDESFRHELASKGYDTFSKDFEIDNYVIKLEELYLNA